MAYVPLEITLLSAHDLDDTDHCDFPSSSVPPSSTSMAVYVVVYVVVGYDVCAMQRTTPDEDGGNNPEWGFTARFVLPPDGLHLQDLHFCLLCRSPHGDHGVGDVRVPIEELLRLASQSSGGPPWGAKFLVSRRLTTPWGWQQGTLRFLFRYGKTAAVRRGDAAAAAADRSLEWIPTGFRAPFPLTEVYGACPPDPSPCAAGVTPSWSRGWWRRWWPRGCCFYCCCCCSALFYLRPTSPAGPLPSPLPVILVYGYPALHGPPVPPPAPAGGARPRWPAFLLLGSLLAVIRLPCRT